MRKQEAACECGARWERRKHSSSVVSSSDRNRGTDGASHLITQREAKKQPCLQGITPALVHRGVSPLLGRQGHDRRRAEPGNDESQRLRCEVHDGGLVRHVREVEVEGSQAVLLLPANGAEAVRIRQLGLQLLRTANREKRAAYIRSAQQVVIVRRGQNIRTQPLRTRKKGVAQRGPAWR